MLLSARLYLYSDILKNKSQFLLFATQIVSFLLPLIALFHLTSAFLSYFLNGSILVSVSLSLSSFWTSAWSIKSSPHPSYTECVDKLTEMKLKGNHCPNMLRCKFATISSASTTVVDKYISNASIEPRHIIFWSMLSNNS